MELSTFSRSQLARAFQDVDACIAGSRFPDRSRVGVHTHECDERSAGVLIDAGFAARHRSWDTGIVLTPEGVEAAT